MGGCTCVASANSLHAHVLLDIYAFCLNDSEWRITLTEKPINAIKYFNSALGLCTIDQQVYLLWQLYHEWTHSYASLDLP